MGSDLMRFLLSLAFLLNSAPVPVAPEPSALETNREFRSYQANFVDCYDGDTCDFIVQVGLGISTYQTVRLYGIDAPELHGATRMAAIEVRDFVRRILKTAHEIELQVPQRRACQNRPDCDERCKYGRLLANLVADGQSVNALLLKTGRARLY